MLKVGFCNSAMSLWLWHSTLINTVNVSAPGFYYIFHVPGCPYRCADAWPSLQASSVLIWSLFGLFTTALWIKLLSTFTGSTQHNITTGPLMLPNQAFPNWFSQNLLIYRDEFRKCLSLSPSLTSGWLSVRVAVPEKVILNLNLQKGSFVNPDVASVGI